MIETSLFQRIRARGLRENWQSVVRRLSRVLSVVEWIPEYCFERRFGILTAGLASDPDVTRPGSERHSYSPSYYRGTRKVLRALTAAETRGVFVDYGSGAGRVLLIAAVTSPFKRVVGVEQSPRLNEIARRNIEHVRSKMSCRPVDLVTVDAAEFTVPDDTSVLFFADSFGGDILASVFRRIRESLRRAPRPLVFIGYNHDSLVRLTSQMDRCDWLRVSRQVRLLGRPVALVFRNTVDVGPGDGDGTS
jgi:SAM-dependent methyltransferase